MYKHENILNKLGLVVDDYRVLYESKADADHSEAAVKERYSNITDWVGDKHIGSGVRRSYDNQGLMESMKGYVE